MATQFSSTYTITQKSRISGGKNRTVVDYADDGTPRLRELSSVAAVTFNAVIEPLGDNDSALFDTYLYGALTTELYIDHNGTRYTGYVSEQSIREGYNKGLHNWTFSLLATRGPIT